MSAVLQLQLAQNVYFIPREVERFKILVYGSFSSHIFTLVHASEHFPKLTTANFPRGSLLKEVSDVAKVKN